jgi:hypothetical protein
MELFQMNDVTEQELINRSVAPRVTEKELEANIRERTFLNHGLLTICILTLQNGFTVTGESACASPENYNQDIGERIALSNAKEKIWPLMGYALREKLHQEQQEASPALGSHLYRKKPVVIEAIQWNKHGDHYAVVAVPPARYDYLSGDVNYDPDSFGWISTLEGGHLVTPGDWIIKGVKGEMYPCKPDIFTQTYDKA